MTPSWRWLMLCTIACGGEEAFCLEIDGNCSPLYEAEFDAVYEQTLVRSCGIGGGSCHSAEGEQAGVMFANADDSWDTLLSDSESSDDSDHHDHDHDHDHVDGALVIPGNASCSPLIQILRSDDPAVLMPPGNPLSEEEICAIEQWIDAGAAR